MKRVMIVGMSGAGKSTLNRKLAAKLGVPSFHLDNIYHLPGWVARPEVDVEKDFDKIAATDGWVVDGNYRRMSGALQDRADTLVFLDFPRVFCMMQITKRFLLHRLGLKKRVDLAEGFNEKVSLAFYSWVWQWRANNRERWMVHLAPMMEKVVFLKSRRDVNAWLENVR